MKPAAAPSHTSTPYPQTIATQYPTKNSHKLNYYARIATKDLPLRDKDGATAKGFCFGVAVLTQTGDFRAVSGVD